MVDSDRFTPAVSQIAGKRLTWTLLTGKAVSPAQALEQPKPQVRGKR
jgi:hypothetical protein